MKTIRFTDKELGVKLRAKVKYGNCSQLDNLIIAAKQASIKLDIQEQQLATAKVEIADYREALECLIIEHGIHDSYDGGLLPDSEQSLTIQAAIKLLAKHKVANNE